MSILTQEQINVDLFDEVKRLKGEIIGLKNELGEQTQWVSVKDKFPQDKQEVDVWIIEEGFGKRSINAEFDADAMVFVTNDGDYDAYNDGNIDNIVTHWMPTLEEPKGVE